MNLFPKGMLVTVYNLIIDKNENIILTENGNIVEKYKPDNSIEGNIYIGRVKNKLKGMQVCFVDIGEERNAFLQYNSENYEPKVNEKLVVQVTKKPIGDKGAIVTQKIKLTGKYIVLLPTEKHIAISQKITDIEEIERLKKLLKENLSGYGAIIRTNAQNETDEIIKDINILINIWQKINIIQDDCPVLIYKSEEFIKKFIKNITEKNIEEIIVGSSEKSKVDDILKELDFNIKIKIEEKDMENEIKKLNRKKVWLKSGGFIIIETTEALNVIDVNSGGYTGRTNMEKTAEKINKEATLEIARQIRLRNLRGIIIIDYINIKNVNIKNEIIDIMKKETMNDRTKVDILGFTRLGLLEMTRKEIG